MASPEAGSVLAENVALQQSMRADIELLAGPRAGAAVPLDRDRRRGCRRFRPLRRGLVRSAEPGRPVSQCRQDPRHRHRPRSRHRHRPARRPHRGGAAGERRQHRLRRPRQRGRPLGRGIGGAGGRGAAGGAAQALRLRHRLPRGLRRAASRAADRRPVGRVVPARGPLLPVRQVPRGEPGAAGNRPRGNRPCLLRDRGLAAAGGAGAGVRKRQGGERLGRLLRHQHARPERRDRRASRASPISISPTASPATAPSRRRARAAASPS